MDTVMLSRIQFASTTIFHYFFVPVSIGLALMIAIMETMYVRKGNEEYKRMAQFWGKLFLINFAVGVVTGILQEFQFGMNWSDYSRFVGDVFGAPLAIEALLAFFLESTFIGIWIFGWDKVSKKIHLLSIWMVALGTTLSAFWILTANSFMQHPVGFEINNGRAEMNDFLALITNGQLLVELPHTLLAAYATGAFLVTGISAYKMLKKQDVPFFRKSFEIAAIVGIVSSVGVAVAGHAQAQYLVETQPMKMAASEGLWEDSGDPAAWTVTAFIDPVNKVSTGEIKIPYLLSFLSYSKFSGEVKGMNTLQAEYEQEYGPGNYIPPVRTTFWSFRIMVAAGSLMVVFGLYAMYLMWRKKMERPNTWFLRFMFWGLLLPPIANTAGWIMTEIGRQPWTVFGLMTTEDSVSPNVSAGSVLFSVITFNAIYAILGIVLVGLFIKVIKKGPYHMDHDHGDAHDPYSKEGTTHAFS
ncbi:MULTISPECIES: cytochrome ubiquinol oxidase subunit I [unclassified Paenibacillus]|uniref:cytochrome ubiquinol oxidase subunit I n=1 Tax=unclassified Paenibacillus TaxID=185978 RepID=UPI00240659C7|nr:MULTISPECIES: cytochrome ubiquinol oxidase subunit I [unclassified Paenibacillus]MDF9839739.1 cytochrome d ubiquinol oxidase subunit I [Paenibacillus sp. PastF-2]MDF9846319.1 cytochrome d ubiquinol oxidase subunit I [Paenibacillus sp. PastM-2]MDF9853331.1 cytochrome d ubiquinol oxidase subunit I [Paenibacillus sp. PastF-1]MDH6478165.1 cytochrome d ubiquinol oxidase subunit I [Paenibacillus sp. PastH-2]MDH6506336.1 cytochrome d ubiquinol oxidase subunit I [Paenibacillus sp. PastM-3]